MPLVLSRFTAAIPLKTESSVVLRIELPAVDRDDTPKVVVVPLANKLASNCP